MCRQIVPRSWCRYRKWTVNAAQTRIKAQSEKNQVNIFNKSSYMWSENVKRIKITVHLGSLSDSGVWFNRLSSMCYKHHQWTQHCTDQQPATSSRQSSPDNEHKGLHKFFLSPIAVLKYAQLHTSGFSYFLWLLIAWLVLVSFLF